MIVDIYNACSMAGSAYSAVLESMIIAAVIYLCLTSVFSIALRKIEKMLGAPTKALTSSN